MTDPAKIVRSTCLWSCPFVKSEKEAVGRVRHLEVMLTRTNTSDEPPLAVTDRQFGSGRVVGYQDIVVLAEGFL